MVAAKNSIIHNPPLILKKTICLCPFTALLCGLLGAALGYIAWKKLNPSGLAWLSGTASTFCMICATAIWSMRDKAAALTEQENASTRQYKGRVRAENALIKRSTLLASLVAVCSLVASSTAIAHQFNAPIYQWMPIFGGLCVGLSSFGYLLANSWESQLRQLRHNDALQQKEMDERNRIIERLSRKVEGADSPPYWEKQEKNLERDL